MGVADLGCHFRVGLRGERLVEAQPGHRPGFHRSQTFLPEGLRHAMGYRYARDSGTQASGAQGSGAQGSGEENS